MEPIISKCGYRCDLCPAYEPNIKSEADKQRMCDAWARYFGLQIPVEEFSGCAGCFNEGGDTNCAVRLCVDRKGLENCGDCDLFACEELRTRMDYVEQNVKDASDIPQDDYDLFIKPFISRERLLKIRKSLDA